MIETSYSLYKLIILYMLNKASFPLTNAQISDMMLGLNYTSYFRLQEVLSDMTESGLLQTEPHNHTTHFLMTDDGRQMLDYFRDEVSPEIRQEIVAWLDAHACAMREDSQTFADYNLTDSREYTVRCVIREGSDTLMELNLSVPSEAAAAEVAENWKQRGQEVYASVMKALL